MFEFPASREYIAGAAEEEDWIIDSILPGSSLTLITGKEGTQKTTIAIGMSRAVATGQSFFQQDVVQGKVLYMNLDRMRGKDVARSLREYAQTKDLSEESADWIQEIVWQEGEFDLLGVKTTEEGQVITDSNNLPVYNKEILVQYIREKHIKLVIMDTLHKLATSSDLNEDKSIDMDRLCVVVRDIARDSKAAVVLLHHTPVTDDTRGRGSGAIAATVDHVISVRSEGSSTQKLILELKKTRTSSIQLFPIYITDVIAMNPVIAEEIGEPVGPRKALIEQAFVSSEEFTKKMTFNIRKFYAWAEISAEPYGPENLLRTMHRSSVMKLFENESGTELVVNYVRDHFKKEGKLRIISQGEDPCYELTL